MSLSQIKQMSISLGLYKPARFMKRAFSRTDRPRAAAYKKLYSRLFSPGDLVFDVGANIGSMTEIMLSLGAYVIAFEPQPICAREITARGNGRLTVVEKAIGEAEGTAAIYLTSSSAVASLLPGWNDAAGGSLQVAVTTLDQAIAQFGEPTFCKIDIEGFELHALRGLSKPIKALSLEYQTDERGMFNIRRCVELISQIGDYRINLTAYEDGNLILPSWLHAAEFLAQFPCCAREIAYGDLILKREDTAI